MTLLADLEDLVARLDFELDPTELRVAATALEDASELARFHGNPKWGVDFEAPPMARTLVLRAAKRYMDNPQGYTTSRAGDETLMWHDAESGMGEVHFTADEIKMFGRLSGSTPPAFGTIPLYAWNTRLTRGPGYVPVAGGTDRFPLFADEDGPW